MPDCNPLKLTELKSDFLHELYTTAEQKDHSEYDSSYKKKKKLKTQLLLCIFWEANISELGERQAHGEGFLQL